MEKLKVAIDLLKEQISELKASSESSYNTGDNKRGNIQIDAAIRLEGNLAQLQIGYDYIVLALA